MVAFCLRRFLLVSTVYLSCTGGINAQIDFNNPPWKTGCESNPDANQMEMNECSYIQFNIADSILNAQYEFLINKEQKFYNEEKKYLKDENDSFTLNLLKQSENKINAIKNQKLIS